jgi:hypothetical protein
MSALQNELDELIAEQRKLKLQFQKRAQELFKATTKEFFEKNPAVTIIRWNQYTPYFNDGDECVFSVYEPHFTNCPVEDKDNINNWGEYEGDDESIFSISDPSWIMKSDSIYYKKDKEILLSLKESNQLDIDSLKAFGDMIQSSEMEDVMRAMFDDHVTVTVTREGFEVEELEHD